MMSRLITRLAFSLSCLIFAPTYAAGVAAARQLAAIRSALDGGCAGFRDGDSRAAIGYMLDSAAFRAFDLSPPRIKTRSQLLADNVALMGELRGTPRCRYIEVHPVLLSRDAAFSWSIMRLGGLLKNGKNIDVTIRVTDVWRRTRAGWRAVHEHSSFPVNVDTGQADLQSRR